MCELLEIFCCDSVATNGSVHTLICLCKMKTMWLMKLGSGVFSLLRNIPAFGTGTFLRVLILSFFNASPCYNLHCSLDVKKQIICQLCNVQYHSQWPFRSSPPPTPPSSIIPDWFEIPTYCNIGIGLSLFWSSVVPALNCHPFTTRVVVCQDTWPCRRGIFKGASLLNACYV